MKSKQVQSHPDLHSIRKVDHGSESLTDAQTSQREPGVGAGLLPLLLLHALCLISAAMHLRLADALHTLHAKHGSERDNWTTPGHA